MFASCGAEREMTGKKSTDPSAHKALFGLHALWRAYRACRQGKRQARDTQGYEARLLDRLVQSRDALASLRWRPSRTFSFVVSHPKAREIHASPFADRVVHHVITERLDRLYERVFIHDSYANRVGKGTHAAVDRLQGFMREATLGGAQPAFALQLDIANFFNSIHRPTLFRLVQARLQRDVRAARVDTAEANGLQTLCRVLLEADPTLDVRQRGPQARRALVPAHKRLGAVGPTCGLPIGNLTSQFFANVYLNELDQFVKHTLQCRWYVRYVDDFVLLHPDAGQLVLWRGQIETFLAERLSLKLKVLALPHALQSGTDFLGFVIRPFYRLARARVVRRMYVALAAYERRYVQGDWAYRAGAATASEPGAALDVARARGRSLAMPVLAREALRAQLASFAGHLSHAQSLRLWARTLGRFAWLAGLFHISAASPAALTPRWALRDVPSNLHTQYTALRTTARRLTGCHDAVLVMQIGWTWVLPTSGLQDGVKSRLPGGQSTQRPGLGPCTEWPAEALPAVCRALKHDPPHALAHALAAQTGHYPTGFKQRTLVSLWTPSPPVHQGN
jgi:RNA-directed DNA polymerase